jgi:cytochrome c oxidase assembly protein subunit 15
MRKIFPSLVTWSLILVYLVIIAGALVRMTGSGMGCPDWPKCFGYYIPPTDASELQWQSNRNFKKGQVIIYNEQLLVAKKDFLSSSEINLFNWMPYTKHDYAKFNVYHTWTEYINRLCGALAGIACFAMAIASIGYWKDKKKIVLLSWMVVFMMGFQAWLGAKVVESVLNPVKITTHMIVALLIVAVILYIKYKVTEHKNAYFIKDKQFKILLWLGLIFSLIQVVLGTQLRQFVDEQIKQLGYNRMNEILSNPQLNFYIHRSFSIVIIILAIYTYFVNKKKVLGFQSSVWIVILVLLEILTGMSMYYLHFPFGMQTAHLLFASILFGVQFYLILQYGIAKSKNSIRM